MLWLFTTQMFFNIGVLEISQISQENTCVEVLKACNFINPFMTEAVIM